MNMEHKEEIMYSDDRAAQFVTNISGWVSRHGRFYGNDEGSENIARYDGCTSRECDICGKPTGNKSYVICLDCKEKKNIKKYLAMPEKEWDGKSMLYSDAFDEWFGEMWEVEDYCNEETSYKAESLRLVIAEPVYYHGIDDEHYVDIIAEDCDVDGDVLALVAKFNADIKALRRVASWEPGKYRLKTEKK
jgi:hypothetical protein